MSYHPSMLRLSAVRMQCRYEISAFCFNFYMTRVLQRKAPKKSKGPEIEIISHRPDVETPAVVLPPKPQAKVHPMPVPQYATYNLPKITGEVEDDVLLKLQHHIYESIKPAYED